MTIGSEYVGFEKYLEILHCLPALKRLNICMIGPETDHHLMVPMQVPCRDAQGNKSCILNISIHLAFYHDFATLGKFTQPDLVLGLNVGLHEQPFSHMTANTWLPTLQLLVDKSIPTVFTSFTHEEWEKDTEVAWRAWAKITLPGQPNPWRSLQPLQEMEVTNTFFYLNHIMWAFEGCQP